MPLLGFGTYQIPETAEGINAIDFAIRQGYKLVDCASFYKNEASIGKVVESHDRNTLFIVSKCWNDAVYQGPEAVRKSCLRSISDLRCGYLDLYLIHWPVPEKHLDAYRELIRLREEGFVRDIGVSNYTIEDFEQLMAAGVSVVPAVNQIEINPFLHRRHTIDYFRSKGVVPMSFRGLRNAAGFDNPVLQSVATRLNVTPAQLLGRWLVQQGICHIPKSINHARIMSNAQIFDFNLEESDLEALNSLMTPDSLSTFLDHYSARIVRDTPLPLPDNLRVTVD